MYETYGKPIILLTPYQSRDHAAAQDWAEPLSSAPGVERDWMAQADLYQTLFESVIDEPWFAGLVPYGYSFFDSFHPDLAVDRSYNVRNKPGGMVVRSWFSRIDAQAGP
jgi:hypothetical protein